MFIICVILKDRIQACGAKMNLVGASIEFESKLHDYYEPGIVRDIMNELNPEMSDGNCYFKLGDIAVQMKRI